MDKPRVSVPGLGLGSSEAISRPGPRPGAASRPGSGSKLEPESESRSRPGSESDSVRTVTLFWKREQYENGERTASDSFTIDNASWTLRNGTHYVTYEDNLSDGPEKPQKSKQKSSNKMSGNGVNPSGMAIRTTLRISNDELTLIRHGAVRWNHSFRVTQRTSSTMHVGEAVLAIETMTKSLTVNLASHSGEVILVYDMDLSGMTQTVKLWIQFGEHDGESAEKASN